MKKIAWVLGGGGARGSWQFGVMSNLLAKRHCPDIVVGCSVGALNAAGFVFNTIGDLRRVWMEIRGRRSVFSLNLNPFASGIYDPKPLKKMINKLTVGAPRKDIEAIVTYTDLQQGVSRYASSQSSSQAAFRMAVLASTCIPVVVEPLKDRYVDGAVREMAPLKKAIDRGAAKIIVILCSNIDPFVMHKKYKRKLDVAIRSLDVMMNEILVNDIKMCMAKNDVPGKRQIEIEIIEPPRSYRRDSLDFSPEAIREGMEIGERWDTLTVSKSGSNKIR